MNNTRSLAGKTLAGLLAAAILSWAGAAAAAPLRFKPVARTEGEVAFVIDGDTIVLQSGEKVRYLGIDAPEMAHDGQPADCFANEAKQANAELVLGKKVRLEYGANVADRYGRLLAFVYLPDGRCVNSELVKSGHASLYKQGGGLMPRPSFLARQREAVAKRAGMWGACSVEAEPYYIGNRRSFVFHRPNFPYQQKESGFDKKKFETRWKALAEGFSPCRQCKP